MRKGINLFVLIFALTLLGCYDRGEAFTEKVETNVIIKDRQINYRQISVPEEGGMKFIRFTDEDEYVAGPNVKKNKGVISWYTSSLIDIDPNEEKVAFIGLKDGKTNIYIKSLLGGKTTIQRTFRDNVYGVAFSADGKMISFVDYIDDNYNVYQIKADKGAAIQEITKSKSSETSPVYSTDNKLLFYTKSEYSSTNKYYRYYIWSYNLTNSLTTQYSEGFSPCISKDNKLMYVTRNDKETGLGEIWSVNMDTGEEIRIVDDREKGFSTPKISPDGTKLLVTGSTLATKERIENLDLYTVNVDGSNLTQLTFHPGNDVSGVWSPKGDKIYFLSQRGNEKGNYGIWMINY